MPDWLIELLIFVFIAHFVAFVRLAYIRKDRRYILVSLTFFLLILSFSTRLWWPRAHLGPISIHWDFRIAAWTSTLAVIVMLLKRRFFSSEVEFNRERVSE